ncbi:hypothetical protein BGZ59_007103 [Podila verticillata]|nr:hypothetical protein BGZ59_007103 [Podila verticillata]
MTSGQQVVAYQGDPKDIWEAVEVTTMGSRWSFLPLGLPNAILLTIQYTMSFSLALSVLNIVPARHLDGHHALKAFFALVQSLRQSYKSTQSLQESLVECLTMGAHAIRREFLDDDDDDDDFEPSTPNTIRHRHVVLSQQLPRAKKPLQKSSSQPSQGLSQSKKRGLQSMRPPSSTLLSGATSANVSTSSGVSQSAEAGPSLKRKNGISLPLKKPPLAMRSFNQTSGASNSSSTQETTNPFLSPPPRPSPTPTRKPIKEAVIVLDSESEDNSDVEAQPARSTSNEVPVSKSPQERQIFGGVTKLSPKVQYKQPDQAQEAVETKEDPVKYTQESIASSQGSVDYSRDQAHHDHDHNFSTVQEDNNGTINNDNNDNEYTNSAAEDNMEHYNTRWSMSPEISNPFLSDLVAAPSRPSSSSISVASGHHNEDSLTMSTFHDVSTPRDTPTEAETTECVICGKDLSHLDSGRIVFHINNCIDEQQEEQTAIQSLDLDSSVQPSASQGEFAGARVDYLARVNKCPICKQDWPLKAQSRKARQKVEHLKRCAKVHKKSVQSLLYQMRLLKERYERSLALGTPMTDPVEASQEVEPADQIEEAVQESIQGQDSRGSAPTPKLKPKPTTILKQVVSLTDSADADFTSDAIITTVHAPVPTRPKQSRLNRLLEDQNDESLQLALAISMSMDGSDGGSASASRAGSPLGSGGATKWALVPKSKGTNKRRKRSEREMNETTILPYAEIQDLIQANVTALLFPEDEAETEVKEPLEEGRQSKMHRGLQTPPWRPSRFASGSGSRPPVTSELDANVSQSSEASQTSPKRSLWSLSRLKDTGGMSALDLDDMSKERQEAQAEEGYRLGSEEPSSGPMSTSFDRDHYVARFMKEYLQREKDDRQSVSRTSSAPTSTSHDSNVVRGEVLREQDNKFTSPLWSVANKRRTSILEEESRRKEQEAAQILEDEIRQHLDELDEQVQRAKKQAHANILSSLEKYNEKVRQPKIPSPIKQIMVDENEGELEDDDNWSNYDHQEYGMDMEDIVNTQDTLDLDDYPRPSSPLLRFSKREELGAKDTVASPPIQVIELHSDPSVLDHYSYDYHQDISFDNNYSPNNNNLSPRNNDNNYNSNRPSPDSSPTLELDRSMELCQVDDLEDANDGGGILVYSPPVSPEFGTTRVPPRSQRQQQNLSDISFSSPPQLPPPLDFAKLGFPGAANLTQEPVDPELTPPPPNTRSILSPGLIGRRLDCMRTIGSSNGSPNDDDVVEDNRQESDDTYRWRNVSTPKRKARSQRRDDGCGNGQERDDDEVGDSEDIPTRVPRRPKSATKTRSIAPFKRTTAAVSRYAADFMNRANEFAASSQSQLEDTTTNAGVLPPSSQAGLATPSRKKNKGKVDMRVEAMARESARLADNLRQQHEVPDYQTMNMDQLRTVAKTFGLKSMRKNVLVEQLTAIWHKLNPNPKPRPEPEPELEPELDDQDRDRDDDSGLERHVVDGTFPESSFGPSQGQRYVGKGKDRADDYGPTRWSRPYDAPTIFSSDLDEGSNGSSEESDLEDESEDEEEEDEDMDLDPENEGEGSSERPIRGGFGGGGPGDDNALDDRGKEDQEDREPSSPTLERRLLQFLNSRSHFRKQLLMYKPLDLEVVWAECDAAGIECTRKELRQFLDRRGIICIVPADSVVGSWRKTRAKKQKRH